MALGERARVPLSETVPYLPPPVPPGFSKRIHFPLTRPPAAVPKMPSNPKVADITNRDAGGLSGFRGPPDVDGILSTPSRRRSVSCSCISSKEYPMMRRMFGAGAALILALTLPGLAADKEPIKVLIITGDHGHNWKETTPFIKDFLT